jgi:hypothetical protein
MSARSRKPASPPVLKAHGHKPQWLKGKKNQLTSEALTAYQAIDLDSMIFNGYGLRHEASRGSLVFRLADVEAVCGCWRRAVGWRTTMVIVKPATAILTARQP